MSTSKMWFAIKYEQKERVKKLGAKWDRDEKKWYAPNVEIKQKLLNAAFIAEKTEQQILDEFTQIESFFDAG